MSYQIGKVYIFCNQRGWASFLNGEECTVTGPTCEYITMDGKTKSGQPTDYMMGEYQAFVQPGDLRPKEPPSGERLIMDKFNAPDLVPA